MANLVQFEMRVKGSKEACKTVYKTQHFAECYEAKEKRINGSDYMFISGECKGGINSYTSEDDVLEGFDITNISESDIETICQMNIQTKSALLQCEIEAFSFYDDSYEIWHCRYKNGEELANEELSLEDAKGVKFDPETYALDCSKAFSLGSKDESIKKLSPVLSQDDKEAEEEDIANFVIEGDTLKYYYGKSEKVIIPPGVKEIGMNAFEGNRNLVTIVIPEGVTSIAEYAFSGCSNLENVILPDPTIGIDEGTFDGCKALTKDNFVVVGNMIYEYCGKSAEVIVPDHIEAISGYAFAGNSKIKKVVLPEEVYWIGKSAFDGCTNLEEINVSDGAKIGYKAFSGCEKLASDDGLMIFGDTLFAYLGQEEQVEVPSGVRIISTEAFSGNATLIKVVLPDSLEVISQGVFKNCKSLKEVNFPHKLIRLDVEAFKSCKSLKNIVLPEGLEVIEYNAFAMCESLESLIIPKTVKKIGGDAFLACRGLKKIEVLGEDTDISSTAFRNCEKDKIPFVAE